jgi:hypothetical protein
MLPEGHDKGQADDRAVDHASDLARAGVGSDCATDAQHREGTRASMALVARSPPREASVIER